MTDPTDAIPPGLADLPLEVRRAREIEREREIEDGIARRHVVVTADERAYAAAQFARAMAVARDATALLRGC